MYCAFSKKMIVATSLACAFGPVLVARAQSPEGQFYKAYYLENEARDADAAARLYAEVVENRAADDAVRKSAEARLRAVSEEQVSADFARLFPPTVLAYAEIRQPGEQIINVVKQLGLLADNNQAMTAGAARVAISPELVRGILGIRGVAAALTGFDPVKQRPAGVVVFHPGDMEFVRGAIETGLPIAAMPAEPIKGFPTYDIEGEALVTLTSRLVIASPQRSQIEAVVRRLSGEEKSSLATANDLREMLSARGDSLLFFCVNAKPMIPLLNGLMQAGASQSQELAVARAVLDPESLEYLVGKLGVGAEGASLDMSLKLKEGHHNLVYNFLRTPAVSMATLKSVPAEAAAFVVGALNESNSRFTPGTAGGQEGKPIVTALDVGREIFANITSFAVFALPPQGDAQVAGAPVPDVAAAITVNDTAKSLALWGQALGIASLASAGRSLEGTSVNVEGTAARKFDFPDGIAVYLGVDGNDLLLASTPSALARSIRAKRSGGSILDDGPFVAVLKRITADTTKALFVHPGRCAEIAAQFESGGDATDLTKLSTLMADTVVSMVVEHSDNMFHIWAGAGALPDIGGFLSELLEEKRHSGTAHRSLRSAMKSGQWDRALAGVDTLLENEPDSLRLLRDKFRILAVGIKDDAAAAACGERIVERAYDSALYLNNFAWGLLTEDEYAGRFSELALRASDRSNALTDLNNWAFVDTLALAKFETGEVRAAVELEKRAIELANKGANASLQIALDRFERALWQSSRSASNH